MGRLIGLPHFLSDDALDEEKSDATAIRKAKDSEANDASGETSQVFEVQAQIALRMKNQFNGQIIRRTSSSKDWEGKDLIALPGYDEHLLIVEPTDREMEIISEHADNVKEL